MKTHHVSLLMLTIAAHQVCRIAAFEAFKGFVRECAEMVKIVNFGCSETKFHDCLATKTSSHAVLKVMSANLKTLVCMETDRANVLLAKRGHVALLSSKKISTTDDAALDRVMDVIRTEESLDEESCPGITAPKLDKTAAKSLLLMLLLRQKFISKSMGSFPATAASLFEKGKLKTAGAGGASTVKLEELRNPLSLEMKQGIVNVLDKSGNLVIPVPSRDEFLTDLAEINKLAADKAV